MLSDSAIATTTDASDGLGRTSTPGQLDQGCADSSADGSTTSSSTSSSAKTGDTTTIGETTTTVATATDTTANTTITTPITTDPAPTDDPTTSAIFTITNTNASTPAATPPPDHHQTQQAPVLQQTQLNPLARTAAAGATAVPAAAAAAAAAKPHRPRFPRVSSRGPVRFAPSAKRPQPSSPPERPAATTTSGHRRAGSDPTEVKEPKESAGHPTKSATTAATTATAATTSGLGGPAAADANPRRNTSLTSLSHPAAGKRTIRSGGEKLRKTGSGNGGSRAAPKPQVRFALGNEDDGDEDDEDGVADDEWVDASRSASPHLSRNPSVRSTPAESESETAPAATNAETESTVRDTQPGRTGPAADPRPGPPSRVVSSHDPTAAQQHKEYLTSRILRRCPSSQRPLAPPKISAAVASASQTIVFAGATLSGPTAIQTSDCPVMYENPGSDVFPDSQREGVTSRFVAPTSAGPAEGSYYNPGIANMALPSSPDTPARRRSTASLDPAGQKPQMSGSLSEDEGDRALAPKPTKRPATRAGGENYRTQMKLELQRASAVIEPGQPAGRAGTGIPLVGVSAPSFDGGRAKKIDGRISKLLERTRMEYLVVHRYLNPLARSLGRIAQQQQLADRARELARSDTDPGPLAGMRPGGGGGGVPRDRRPAAGASRHGRNGSMPESHERRPGAGGAGPPARRPALPRALSTIEVTDYDSGRLGERFSIGELTETPEEGLLGNDEDRTAMLLRSIWEKPTEIIVGG